MSAFLYLKAIVFGLLSQLGLSTAITSVLTNISLVAIAAGLVIALPHAVLLALVIVVLLIFSQSH